MELNRADFESLVGQALPLKLGEHDTHATVAEVRAIATTSTRNEPFSLTLHVPADVPYGQGVHRLMHPSFGALDLFMVPLGPKGAVMRYEVIFN